MKTKTFSPLILFTVLVPSITTVFDKNFTFFDTMNTVSISPSTVVLLEEIEALVMKKHSTGDRSVRRYFDKYYTPFVDMQPPKRSRNT